MKPPAFELEALEVSLGGQARLRIDRLQAPAGQVGALLGPNGAGKTTFLRACLGLVPIRAGRFEVLGEAVAALRGTALARLRRRIGYVPQLLPTRSQLPLTVREVVAIGRTGRAGLFRALSRTDEAVIERWIAQLGLERLADRAFSELSGGEQRKTVIARAMAQEPELLLLDEPTAHLDLRWRERIVHTIHDLHATSALSILLVCHELEVLPPGCHQVALLDAGRLLASGPPRDVLTPDRIQQLYGSGFRLIEPAGRLALVPDARHG